MDSMHYLFIALFLLLAISKDTRKACMVFLASYLLYKTLILPVSGFYYYHFCALLNLVIGFAIIKKHFVVGCLSFSLIPTNLFGYFLFMKFYDPTIYDNIALTIISLQLITLAIRSLHGIFTRSDRDGKLANTFRLLVVRIVMADSVEKNKKTMEKLA
jgi:hypothetical protein